ncbi:MAG: hypothetical protein IPG52_15760 [Rhodocyclaceae bacterium]|nr:hypothetical protein [Rhodocyclaceae bacterium]
MEAVAPHALFGDPARQGEALGELRLVAMKGRVKQATCGTPGRAAAMASMPAKLCGWCSDISGTGSPSRSIDTGSSRIGRANFSPPC